jgi:hypothetical protein
VRALYDRKNYQYGTRTHRTNVVAGDVNPRGGKVSDSIIGWTPDDVAERLAASRAELSRRALEAFALEEHKAGRIAEAQVQRLLGFATRDELDRFLKAHEVWLAYTLDDLERERAALRRLGFPETDV